jgi:hypothetical protein
MLKFATIILLFYTLACVFLYIKQRDLLYFPTPENTQVNATAIWIEQGSHRLKIWKINEGENAIIYFGGNAESVEYNIPEFRQFFAGYTVYLVNYRGYGGSSGSPSEQALFEDAAFIYDEIKKQHPSIGVIGRSLGSGVACYLASEREVDRLALITPYDSIEALAQSLYPVFPVKWLLKDAFDSLSCAPSLSNPVLVLIAQNDQVIPLKRSENLLQSLTQAQVESHIIEDATHNDISSSAAYQQLLKNFFEQEG